MKIILAERPQNCPVCFGEGVLDSKSNTMRFDCKATWVGYSDGWKEAKECEHSTYFVTNQRATIATLTAQRDGLLEVAEMLIQEIPMGYLYEGNWIVTAGLVTRWQALQTAITAIEGVKEGEDD